MSTSASISAPAISNSLLDNWIDGWSAAFSCLTDVLTAALTRGPTSLDVPRWVGLVTANRQPTWTLPNEIVFEAPLARLRDFSTSRSRVSCRRSCCRRRPATTRASSTTPPSRVRWARSSLPGSGERCRWTGSGRHLRRLIRRSMTTSTVIDRAIEHCGGRVNLIGDCQGGWLATIYAALYPERVNTLTLAGAPIDFHAGEPVVHEVLRHFCSRRRPALLRGARRR